MAYKLTASYEKEQKTNQQALHMHYRSKVWGQMHELIKQSIHITDCKDF